MAFFKSTWVFTDVTHGVGWTHTAYGSGADHAAIETAQHGYITNVLPLLMNYVFVTAWRITNVDPPRDSLFADISVYPSLHGTYDPTVDAPAGYDVALLFRKDDDLNTAFNKLFLHGVPDAIFGFARTYSGTLPASWAARLAAFRGEMISGVYLVRNKLTPGPGFTYTVQSKMLPLRETTHKVGRPFDLLRGRRRIA